jgi:hypothetical protein
MLAERRGETSWVLRPFGSESWFIMTPPW